MTKYIVEYKEENYSCDDCGDFVTVGVYISQEDKDTVYWYSDGHLGGKEPGTPETFDHYDGFTYVQGYVRGLRDAGHEVDFTCNVEY